MLTVTDIALNRLMPSPRNVRRTGSARIEELAASIAAHGLLQNLTVVETMVKGKKAYEVIAGGRRLAALKLLAKRKQLAANAPVACHVVTQENVTELSLAENAAQEPMHPADQFDAFYALHSEYGMSAEDIAGRFGVTAAVVKQRLKLATVSPKLIEAYRQDEMNLDQLTAFTITDDHARQEKVWAEADDADSRDDLLAALTGEEISASDPLARFVTKEAYVAAGGIIVCDLFDEGGGYFADYDLVCDLAEAKLQAAAESVRAEGWGWVETMRRLDYGAVAQMRRIYPRPAPLAEADQARFDALLGEYDLLVEQEESEAQEAELERLETALDELRAEDRFVPEDIARAGVFIAIGHDGALRIERGYVRPGDEPSNPRKTRAPQEGPPPLSAKLVAELTAHQTVCLRDALGGNGKVALVAVTHALAVALFYPHARAACLDIRAGSRFLDTLSPGISETPAGQRIEARHAAWAKRLPDDPAELWGFVAGLAGDALLALLAHCAGLSVDAVRNVETEAKEGVTGLATSLRLDMRPDWQPTADNYFGRISRTRILEAVREGVSQQAADNLAKLKKVALAEQAEQRLTGKGWLPTILRLAA